MTLPLLVSRWSAARSIPVLSLLVLFLVSWVVQTGCGRRGGGPQAQSGPQSIQMEQPNPASLPKVGEMGKKWSYPSLPEPEPSGRPREFLRSLVFDKEGTRIDREGNALLRDLGAEIKGLPELSVLLIGFCDASEAGQAQTLGMQRAQAVESSLAQYGIPKSAIQLATFGSSQAKAKADEKLGQEQDRRVEIWLMEP